MSTYAVNLASGKTDEKGFFRLLGKLFNQSGVIESTALTVSAQGTPTMSLNISGSAASDNAVFITSNGDCYHGWNTAQTTVTIGSNATGNTMIDSVVAYINLGAGIATSNNPGGLVFTSVRGAAANTAPTGSAIQTAIGANNPYIILANVTVGNGVSSINSGNIVDQRPFAGVSNSVIASAAWTAYTPTWTTAGTAPSLGNGTLSGNYYKIGRMVTCTIYFSGGSTTTFGTSAWAFSLPVIPKTNNVAHRAVGTCYMEDAAIKGYIGFLRILKSNDGTYPDKLVVDYNDPSASGAFGTASASTPFTWGSGDYFFGTFTYEAAS